MIFDIASPPHPWDEDLREDSPFTRLSSSPLLPVGCWEEFAPSPILIVELLPAYLVGTAPNRIFELIYRSEQVSLITERRCSFDVDSFSGLPNSRSDDFLSSSRKSVKRVQLVLVLASQTKQILVEERTAWLTSEDAQVRTFYYEYRNSTSCAYWYKWVNSLPKSFLSHNHTFFSVASSFWACSPNLLGDLLKSRRRK